MNRLLPAIIIVSLCSHILLNFLVLARMDYRLSYFSLLDLGAVIAGVYVTDLISNLIHWVGDCDIPWKNRFLSRFHDLSVLHHKRPADILKQDFFHIKGNIAFFYSPQLLVAYLLAPVAGLSPFVFFLLVNGNLMLLAHSIHKACHKKSAGPVFSVLQSMRLIIPPAYHLAHHSAPFNRNFAAINGWSDPLFSKWVAHWQKRASSRVVPPNAAQMLQFSDTRCTAPSVSGSVQHGGAEK